MDMGSLGSRGNVGVSAPASRTQDIADTRPAEADARQAELLQNKGTSEPNREQVLAAVTDMQDFVQATHHNIQFQLDENSGRMLIKVTERDTGEVIRQIPSEEAVRLAESLSEIRSLLFSAEA
ncbi:MAG: flagellar protein FlaG [Gammaproteobacteria bacterium]|nr:flagellar protein FlaG [Gammaproteobacteria bacterium]